jgi:hypothetical protein
MPRTPSGSDHTLPLLTDPSRSSGRQALALNLAFGFLHGSKTVNRLPLVYQSMFSAPYCFYRTDKKMSARKKFTGCFLVLNNWNRIITNAPSVNPNMTF